jgi:spore germination cell wall hydrolase CwlJ-like protein
LNPRVVRSSREAPAAASIDFPSVNRSAKGDALFPRWRFDPSGTAPIKLEPASLPQPAAPIDEIEAAVRFEPFPEYDISMSLELDPQIPSEEVDGADGADGADEPDISVIAMANDPDPVERTSRIYFGNTLLGPAQSSIEPWSSRDVPVVMVPPAAEDPDLKRSALASPPAAAVAPRSESGGQTIAGKGQVTGEGRRPKSPADRLNLTAKTRERAERCLANAVYFEARSEPVRGQIAVAQVVMNRVFSGFYPDNVCGVVYQNAHRHLACQFTFACDGIRDVVTEPENWERARRIAKATLDGRIWLPEIGRATHYHAAYVRPWWVRSMRKLQRIGLHTFYRPRKWGDGSDAPSWGGAMASAEAAKM